LDKGRGKKLGIIKRLPDGYTSGGVNQPVEKDEFYYHGDHLGSSNMITDAYGAVYQHLEYFPYGESWIEEGGSHGGNLPGYKFTGKELDPETGLYYYGARYYDPVLSRWISADPIFGQYLPTGDKQKDLDLRGMGGVYNPINMGLYTYTHQNPITMVDLDGLEPSKERLGNMSTVINRLASYKGDTLKTFSWASQYESFGYAKVRYIYTKDRGYIDLTHFFRAAEMQYQYMQDYKDTPVVKSIVGSGAVIDAGGVWNEISQTFSKDKNVRKSAWSYEDIPSNRAGIDFAKKFDPSKSFYKQARDYFNKIGAQDVDSIKQEKHFKGLPQKEPKYDSIFIKGNE
jgi:RHS repeat-associated protein